MKKKGLTLAELLIVIAIISALAALLFSVFSSVRERARIVHCINNLKQVGSALHMYAQDHDGFVPPYTTYVDAGESDDYFPRSNDPLLFETAFAPYTRDKQIWYCPLDPFAGVDTEKGPPDWAVQFSPTWAAFYWNTNNHKATSYGIIDVCAMKVFAPIRVDDPPTHREYFLQTGILYSDGKPDDPMNYAIDYTHGNPRGKSVGIYLYFDGTIKVICDQ